MIEHHYRVTKYNPANRDPRWGTYLVEEWAGPQDLGEEVGGHVLTEDELAETINRYLYALEAFAQESGVTRLALRNLVLGPDSEQRWGQLRPDEEVPLDEAISLVRDMLDGQDLLVRLENEDFYVHIGDDMYMWIGSHTDCVKAVAEAQRIGLYAEPGIPSPFLDPQS